ncbi:hypothetical protein EVAR_35301_1 [Eumeta japonica]|uniref:Uncharacterized protein n=1 Tax=Eumeta variegata TaxID=151549 RepID=A0A4C1XHI3_EUMVA|nr:hypothetical protein EVAR_35301_1 [Eumeta japonica]
MRELQSSKEGSVLSALSHWFTKRQLRAPSSAPPTSERFVRPARRGREWTCSMRCVSQESNGKLLILFNTESSGDVSSPKCLSARGRDGALSPLERRRQQAPALHSQMSPFEIGMPLEVLGRAPRRREGRIGSEVSPFVSLINKLISLINKLPYDPGVHNHNETCLQYAVTCGVISNTEANLSNSFVEPPH